MTTMVSNLPPLNSTAVPSPGMVTEATSTSSPQNFGQLINQLLGAYGQPSLGTSATSSLNLNVDGAGQSPATSVETTQANVQGLPLAGILDGNGLPYAAVVDATLEGAVPTGSAATATLPDTEADVPLDDQLSTMMTIVADDLSGQNPASAVLPAPFQARLDSRLRTDQPLPASLVTSTARDTVLTPAPSLPASGTDILAATGRTPSTQDDIVASVAAGDGALPIVKTARVDLDTTLTLPQARMFSPTADSLTAPVASLLAINAPPLNAQTPSLTTLINTLPVPPQHAEFDSELGQRLVWMSKNNVSFAEIRLNPPQLGPIEIRMSVSHDQASVWMNANHAVTRDALEQALPRLRDMFHDAGLQLSEANVSTHSNSQQQQGRGSMPFGQDVIDGDAPSETTAEQTESEIPEQMLFRPTAIDYFA